MEKLINFEEYIGSNNPKSLSPHSTQQVGNEEFDNVGDVAEELSIEDTINVESLKIDVKHHFQIDQVFESRSEMIEWCQEIGRKTMTVVVILKSDISSIGRKGRLTLGCERSGIYRNHNKNMDQFTEKSTINREIKGRQTGTKKCGCPFALKGLWLTGDKWKLEVKCGEHNHHLAQTLVGHSYVGRLNQAERDILVDMTKSGVRAGQILTTIKKRNINNMSTVRSIYNARASLRLAEMEGRSAMQQVMKLLSEHHYVEWHRKDEKTGEVGDIFWAHPESIILAKCFPSVLMVDCTYKTNRFKMPLFEIVGVTSTNKSFTIAFVFMKAETEEHYSWALSRLKTLFDLESLPNVFVTDRELALINAIKSVFPHANRLLCVFHISRNVLANCKKHFKENKEFEFFLNEWTSITRLKSKVEFYKELNAFQTKWVDYPECLKYIQEKWLPLKDHFAYAWTNFVKHFGNTTTNRAESAHSKLKRHLSSSQGNFTTCWMAMHNMIIGEITQVKASFENCLTSTKHLHDIFIFKELRAYVSHFALDLLVLEKNRSENIGIDIVRCGCVLRHTHGLPCAHEIVQFSLAGQSIPLAKIDCQWKKLSSIPSPLQHNEVVYFPEFELFKRIWELSTNDERRNLFEKFNELVKPATTSMQEPKVGSVVVKGRPQKKLTKREREAATSTKRDPSGFEYAMSMEDLQSQATVHLPKVRKFEKQEDIPTMLKYLNQFPMSIQQHINKINDVSDDGNCGFRVVADLLKLHRADDWKKVRKDLLIELRTNINLYLRMFGKKMVERLNNILMCFSSPCAKKNWMLMPYTGHLIASTYKVVLVYLSSKLCVTFLPLQDPPNTSTPHRLLAIGFVNDCHFVGVYLAPNAPIPSISTFWEKYRENIAEIWRASYIERIKHDIIPRDGAEGGCYTIDD